MVSTRLPVRGEYGINVQAERDVLSHSLRPGFGAPIQKKAMRLSERSRMAIMRGFDLRMIASYLCCQFAAQNLRDFLQGVRSLLRRHHPCDLFVCQMELSAQMQNESHFVLLMHRKESGPILLDRGNPIEPFHVHKDTLGRLQVLGGYGK